MEQPVADAEGAQRRPRRSDLPGLSQPDAVVKTDVEAPAETEVAAQPPPQANLPTDPAWAEVQRPLLKQTVKAVIGSTVAISVLFILALFIFIGSGWAPERQYSNIKLAVLDLDGGAFGGALRGAAAHAPFDVRVLPASGAAAVSFDALVADVDAGTYHAALTAEAGATAALAAALTAAGPAFDASAASTLVLDEGRGGAVMVSLLRGVTAQLVSAATASAEQLLLGAPAGAAPVAPRALLLHPVPRAGMHLAAGIAFILTWIIMLTVTMIALQLYDAWERAGIRRDHQIAARLLHEAVCAGCLSFWPPVVLECLGAGLTARTFFALWAFYWLCMYTFGLVITALFRTLGPALGGLAHLLFLILNLVSSGAISPVDLMPSFFRIGFGLPFHNAVAGSRTIMFGSYDHIGRNVGVLLAWIGLTWLMAARKTLQARRELRQAAVKL